MVFSLFAFRTPRSAFRAGGQGSFPNSQPSTLNSQPFRALRAGRGAFTLIELVLVVALMLLLAGAVILNLGSLDSHSRLEEGALQMETLFRYARAQSANTGRQVRIVFGADPLASAGLAPASASLAPSDGERAGVRGFPSGPAPDTSTNGGIQVLWEPDPVGAPGRFEVLPGAALLVEQVNDLVKVQAVGQPGTVASQAGSLGMSDPFLDLFETGETNELSEATGTASSTPPLTCYPDGSSDSLEILLAAANGEDQRLALVTLSGLSGRTRHRILDPASDLDSASADQAQANLGLDR